MKKYFVLGVCLLLGISNARAQVTVGSNETPRAGAILDLKSEVDGTSYKGLALPRVQLTDKDNLYPMFETAPGSGVANDKYDSPAKKAEEDKKHIGLMVYSVGGCDLDGNGVYTWTENGWEKVDKSRVARSGLYVSETELNFLNGDLCEPQDVLVTWSPNGSTGDATPQYTTSGMPFYITPYASAFVNSPQVVSIRPHDFTDAELGTFPLRTRTGEIVFTLDNSVCNDGNQQTHKIKVTQTNYAMHLYGNTIDFTYRPWIEKGHQTTRPIEWPLKTNVEKWKVKVVPESHRDLITSSQIGVENITPANMSSKFEFTATFDLNKDRTYKLVFEDANVPKRFEDITAKLIQCDPDRTHDSSLEWYRDRWELKYGTNPTMLEPDSDGDVSKNPHKVQWHYDQDGNIFFSSIFGNQRWMTTNLSAITYDTEVVNPPTKIINDIPPGYLPTTDVASWGYGGAGGYSDNTHYNLRPRIGMVYNWLMASGRLGYDTKPIVEESTSTTRYQGICPNGWHLPTFLEAKELGDVLIGSPYLYSNNNEGEKSFLTIKDPCEGVYTHTSTQGLSFEFLDGGFALVFPSRFGNPPQAPHDAHECILWTSSLTTSNASGWGSSVNQSYVMGASDSYEAAMFTEWSYPTESRHCNVRCVKD